MGGNKKFSEMRYVNMSRRSNKKYYNETMDLLKQGISVKDIYVQLKDKYEVPVYDSFTRWIRNIHNDITTKNPSIKKDEFTKKDFTVYKNGITTFELEEEIIAGREITPEIIMEAKGLDISQWEVISFTKNIWQQQTKLGTKIDLCQSKLTVKPIKNVAGLKYIVDYFNNHPINPLKFVNVEYLTTKDTSTESLVLDITDLHSGLLSWVNETGNNYDLKIVSKRMKECIDDILSRIKSGRFKKIYISTLGDILHTDNNQGTTTKGTPQQIDGRLEKIIPRTMELFEYMIMELRKFAPIEYIYVPGNHDALTGFMFAYSLMKAFNNYDDITFDIDANPFKARLIGKTLVGFTHGISNKSKNGDWLVNDFRDLFGKCIVAEVHEGHLHTQETKEYNTGVIVRNLPKLCNASAWEHQEGYRSYAAMMCFIYDDNKLHRETWVNYC